jgi:hypothetical protein
MTKLYFRCYVCPSDWIECETASSGSTFATASSPYNSMHGVPPLQTVFHDYHLLNHVEIKLSPSHLLTCSKMIHLPEGFDKIANMGT